MTDTIIDTFEIWMDAQGLKSKGRVKSIGNISLEGITKLRELILDLAVRGKLVPQNKEDEPASNLLKKIAKQKHELISKKIIGKQEKLPEISNAEKIFKIPEGWQWTRLGDIAFQITDGAHHTPVYVSKGVPFLSVKDVSSGFIDFSQTRYISQIQHEELIKRCNPQKGDMLLTKVGTTGIPILVETDIPFSLFVSIALIKFATEFISGEFLSLLIKSPLVKAQSKKGTEGIGNKNLVLRKIVSFSIVIPPLAEQKRIVAKVEELMALCDELENEKTNQLKYHQILVKSVLDTLLRAKTTNELPIAWQRILDHFDTLFCTEDSIDQLKEAILQMAITGKLVRQNPKDEPAGELVKTIEKHKAKLVKEGKLKKEKPLPEISDKEKPFKIPRNWQWVRLGKITNKIGSGSTPRGGNNAYTDSGTIFLRSQNIRNEGLLLDDVAYISAETNERMSNTIVLPDDILLNITGGSLGRCTIFPESAKIANVSQHVTIIRPTIRNTSPFLYQCILSPHIQDLIWGRQVGANREGLSKKVLELFEIPFPPIAEQERIVAKIEQLMALCDDLSHKILRSKEIQNNLAETVVKNAVL